MKRRQLLACAAATAAWPTLGSAAASGEVQVFKNPSCGCCGAWIEHLRAAGFAVKVTEVDDTGSARRRSGMPDRFASCHTALVAGYALEGHVPATDVKRLLTTRPEAVGLAVPGMPAGSPGMEVGTQRDAFDVLLVDRSGRPSVYAHYPK